MLIAPRLDNESILAWALFYARSGFRVFPVGIDKRPLVKWKEEATTNLQTVREWFEHRFADSSIGICTGAVGRRSGVLVIDCDSMEAFKFVKNFLGPVTNTLIAKSGRKDGGFHLYFRYDITNDSRHFRNAADILRGNPAGIDARGEGGFIIAPPSLHASGNRYRWIDTALDWKLMLQVPTEWNKHRDAVRIFNPDIHEEGIRLNSSEKARTALNSVQKVFSTDASIRRQKYAENAIEGKLNDIQNAPCGCRHTTAIKRATHALRLAFDVNLNINAESVCNALFNACCASGLGRNESKQIVLDAMKYAREMGAFSDSEWNSRLV